jgi:threonine dehydrogenase-like Zn-dependent dehydrogenase
MNVWVTVDAVPAVKNLRISDRMVVAFPIACEKCFLVSAGHSPDSFGYSHITGGYAGGQDCC